MMGTVTSFSATSLIDYISRVENTLRVQPHASAHTGDTAGKPTGSFKVTKISLEMKEKIEGKNQAHKSRVGTYGVLVFKGQGINSVWV